MADQKRLVIFIAACNYIAAGLEVIPNHQTYKYPFGIDGWETKNFSIAEIKKLILEKGWNIGVRNMEGLDIDNNGNPNAEEIITKLKEFVEKECPGLFGRLLIEKTVSGGYHIIWSCEVIEGSKKLAKRLPTREELKADPNVKETTLIETKGKGGQFVVSPSAGYKLLQGEWSNLPEITPEERQVLLHCARLFDRLPSIAINRTNKTSSGRRPSDWYNEDKKNVEEVIELLLKNGWEIVREQAGVYYLRRPGKDKGISATFGYVDIGILYNFSSNAYPFEIGKAYNPFQIFALLEYEGNFSAAASEVRKRYGLGNDGTYSQKSQELPDLEKDELLEALNEDDSKYFSITSGFPLLDGAVIGGFRSGSFYIISAPEKAGKTTLVIQFLVYQLIMEKKVAYIDTELGKSNFLKRVAAVYFSLPIGLVDKEKQTEFYEKFKDQLLYVSPESMKNSNYNVDVFQALLKDIVSRGYEVIFVDNFTKFFLTPMSNEARWEKLGKALDIADSVSKEGNLVMFGVLHLKSNEIKERLSQKKLAEILTYPELIFQNTAEIFHKPSISVMYGGAAALSQISGGVIHIWRPFQNFASKRLQSLVCLVLEAFREGTKYEGILFEFDPEWRIFIEKRINPAFTDQVGNEYTETGETIEEDETEKVDVSNVKQGDLYG